ncbi:MAG: hypothetical protein WB791_05640, partial [Waddliaceae bacterium]
ELTGEPYTGNLYVRFDEEGGVISTLTLLFRSCVFRWVNYFQLMIEKWHAFMHPVCEKIKPGARYANR